MVKSFSKTNWTLLMTSRCSISRKCPSSSSWSNGSNVKTMRCTSASCSIKILLSVICRWTEEFFPQIDSRGLEPNYTQQQARQWLASQSEHFKTFLLLASRNSFKSSWSKFFVLSLVAAYPDVRVILVSETHELSTLFVGEPIRFSFDGTNLT